MDNALKERQKDYYKKGKEIEDLFAKTVEKHGFTCLSTSNYEDSKEHLDLKIIRNPIDLYVDIKDEKKDAKEFDATWIELKNVNGDDGWLYGKRLDAIAFKVKDEFWLVDILKLRKVVENKLRDVFLFSKDENLLTMKYRQYIRSGRNDIISLFPLEDIRPLVFVFNDKEAIFKI